MYVVPIIPPDLRHEETIVQAAHALCCLEKTIFSIFDRIDGRIKSNEQKLQSIKNRIGRADKKIKALVGTKKSIKIYAPSRFPATQILREEIPSTFGMTVQEPINHGQESEPNYEIQSRFEQPTAQSTNEKLVFFHVRAGEKNQNDLARSRLNVNQTHGLGQMPEDIAFVTSALRFNTDDFVYDSTDSSSTDRWKNSKLFKKQKRPQGSVSEIRGLQIAPAPHSITHRDNQKAPLAGALRYTPRLADVPDMELPLDLPDLSGIADDIQFVAQEQQRIAPSLLIEDLPDLEELEQQQELESKINESENVAAVTLPKIPIATAVAAVPNEVITPKIPPPPPPLPPPEFTNVNKTETATTKPLPTPDLRSDLMAAIRKAGGVERAKLRPAAPINAVPTNVIDDADGKTKENTVSNDGGGGGLMAELHNKLRLRRKGISKDNEDGDDNAAARNRNQNPLLSNLSSLIPHSSKARARAEQDEDDDDWVD